MANQRISASSCIHHYILGPPVERLRRIRVPHFSAVDFGLGALPKKVGKRALLGDLVSYRQPPRAWSGSCHPCGCGPGGMRGGAPAKPAGKWNRTFCNQLLVRGFFIQRKVLVCLCAVSTPV